MPNKKKPSKKAAPKKTPSKKSAAPQPPAKKTSRPAAENEHPSEALLLKGLLAKETRRETPLKQGELEKRMVAHHVRLNAPVKKILSAVNHINPRPLIPVDKMPEDIKKSIEALKPGIRRFHGIKVSLAYFPFPWVKSPCADKFGYLTPTAVRTASSLPFNIANQVLLGELGGLMGDAGRDTGPDSVIPAGYTYFGQFVDHDITLDVSSTLDTATDANTINNMRSPSLDLDNIYGRGPALDPFLYVFPSTGPDTAIKFVLGTNTPNGVGGPGGNAGFGGMQVQSDFDVPRINNPLNPAASTHTAVIGDPRNDENLIVSQFQHTMLKFHNAVVDLLLLAGFTGDIFVEAKKIVTHHYQWAVVHDFLVRICGAAAVNSALTGVSAPVGSAFRMPVEFSVAAYRLGHSMIRNSYWLNFVHIAASLADVFKFNRNPDLPVFSDRVVDFNAFFDTGVVVPVNNKARKIDTFLSNGLEAIPGGSGIMAILATRNLRRGLALGLPSGQATANFFGIPALTTAQLLQGLPADEVNVLNKNGGILLQKTPLWYYILREAAVLSSGNSLGPVGAKIVADTFIRMLKRDASSFLNVSGGFTPFLPSVTAGDFTVADLVIFSGVNQP
jgi:hypothetical protein